VPQAELCDAAVFTFLDGILRAGSSLKMNAAVSLLTAIVNENGKCMVIKYT